MTQDIVTCDDCGQQNRLPSGPTPTGKIIVCGRCKTELTFGSAFGPDDDDPDFDTRDMEG